MEKLFFLVFLLFIILVSSFFAYDYSYADVINPEFLTKTCAPGQQTITCSGPGFMNQGQVEDGCKEYHDNPNYYYLTGSGGSFGSTSKYCLKGTVTIFKDNRDHLLTGMVIGLVVLVSLSMLNEIRSLNVYK